MKSFLIPIFFAVSFVVQGQSLYQASSSTRKSLYGPGNSGNTKGTTTADEPVSLYGQEEGSKQLKADTEVFGIRVERTMYGIYFLQYGSNVTQSLRDKLEKYLQNTPHNEFKKIGTFYIDILKRDGRYFVIVDERFDDLEEL